MNKTLETGQAPAIIHSEKGEGFHNFFKEQVKKVGDSQFRVQIVTSPYWITPEFRMNYDEICWPKQCKKIL